MPTSLTAQAQLRFSARLSSGGDFGGAVHEPLINWLMQFAQGVAANQADLAYFDVASINASTNLDLDLAGVLASEFGAVITAAELVALAIINKSNVDGAAANLSDLTIGGATNPFIGFLGGTAPTIGPIKPGGGLFLASPGAAGLGAIVAGTGDILRIANGAGGAAVVQIGILARTA